MFFAMLFIGMATLTIWLSITLSNQGHKLKAWITFGLGLATMGIYTLAALKNPGIITAKQPVDEKQYAQEPR